MLATSKGHVNHLLLLINNWLDFTLEVLSSKKDIVRSWLMENWWENGHSTTYNRDFLPIFTYIFTDINRYGSFYRYVISADISALVLLPIPIYRFCRYWPYQPIYCIGWYRYANPTAMISSLNLFSSLTWTLTKSWLRRWLTVGWIVSSDLHSSKILTIQQG